MQDYIAIVSSVGFPIFIAMFVMIRIESKIEKLITGFAQLNDTNEELLDLLQELKERLNTETKAEATNGKLLELLQELNKNLTESKKK